MGASNSPTELPRPAKNEILQMQFQPTCLGLISLVYQLQCLWGGRVLFEVRFMASGLARLCVFSTLALDVMSQDYEKLCQSM